MCKKVGTFDIYTTNVAVKWLELVLQIPGAPYSHLGVELGLLFLVVFLSPSRQVPVRYEFLRLVEVYFLPHVCMYICLYVCMCHPFQFIFVSNPMARRYIVWATGSVVNS